MPRIFTTRLLLFLAVSGAAGGCGPATSSAPDHIDAPITRIPLFGRTLERRVVPLGSRVAWINEDRRDHSVTSPTGLWDSGRIRPGDEFSHRFDQPGEYPYVSVYDRKIRGVILVEAQ